jgi:hypothetical protein
MLFGYQVYTSHVDSYKYFFIFFYEKGYVF